MYLIQNKIDIGNRILEDGSLYAYYMGDPSGFCKDIFHITPDIWQESILQEKYDRILLNCHRQAGKTMFSAIKSLHRAIFYSGSLILIIAPTQRQSQELLRYVRKFIRLLPTDLFTNHLEEDNKLSLELWNGSRVVSLPGTPETIRGFPHVNLVILDEAAQLNDGIQEAVSPMLMRSKGTLMMMSTPFGRRGMFYKNWFAIREDTNDLIESTVGINPLQIQDDWHRIELKAIDNPLLDGDYLKREKRSMPEWKFRQEYGCEFISNQSTYFDPALIQSAIDHSIQPINVF